MYEPSSNAVRVYAAKLKLTLDKSLVTNRIAFRLLDSVDQCWMSVEGALKVCNAQPDSEYWKWELANFLLMELARFEEDQAA